MVVDFINYIQSECKRNKIRLSLAPVKYIYVDGDVCFGSFDKSTRSLNVSIKNDSWIEVLAHEFGHVQQFLEDSDLIGSDFDDAAGVFGDHLAGKTIEPGLLLESAQKVVLCEIDAEIRALGYLTSFGISEGLPYIEQANAYIFGHAYAVQHGRWQKAKTVPTGLYKEQICRDPFGEMTDLIMNHLFF